MLNSFVMANRVTPFVETFQACMNGAQIESWQDLFRGRGSVRIFEAVYQDRKRDPIPCDHAEYEFEWGPTTCEAEFRAFRERQILKGDAILEETPTYLGQKVLISFRPWHTAVSAMESLEDNVRWNSRRGILADKDVDGSLRWHAKDGQRARFVELAERVSVPSST